MEVAGQLELFVWVGRNSTKLVHTYDVVFSSPLLFDHHERKKSYSLFLVEKNMNQQRELPQCLRLSQDILGWRGFLLRRGVATDYGF